MKKTVISSGYKNAVPNRKLTAVTIRPAAGNPRRGGLTRRGVTIPVALGRGSILANKREGDGGTPRGTFRPRQLWWRADRHIRPRTHLPVRRGQGQEARGEDPGDRPLNTPGRL